VTLVASAWSWFAAHAAGGLLTAVLVGGTHLILQRRHLREVTRSQTRHFDVKTDQQTAELKDGSERSRRGS
jgi:hypothetical protein